MILLLTACSSGKDDSVPISPDHGAVEPSYYLGSPLVTRLLSVRERVLQDPRAQVGRRITYAFDLYVRAGKAYKKLLADNYQELRGRVLSGDRIEWFFLSGGYGIIHAREKAAKYQATFNQAIASKMKIPYTAKLWKPLLSDICDGILAKLHPDLVYVFGSGDYTEFIKQTNFWKTKDNIRVFESTGQSGTNWLSPILGKLVRSVFHNTIADFNERYNKFNKQ